jgi:hypothetical protein
MSFHEDVECLLQLIKDSNTEATKEYYFKKLENLLDNYVQKRLQLESQVEIPVKTKD